MLPCWPDADGVSPLGPAGRCGANGAGDSSIWLLSTGEGTPCGRCGFCDGVPKLDDPAWGVEGREPPLEPQPLGKCSWSYGVMTPW